MPLRSVKMDEELKSCYYYQDRLIVKLSITSWKAVLVKNYYHRILLGST